MFNIDDITIKSKRIVYKELKEPFLAFEKSYKTENNQNTYKLGVEFLSKFSMVLLEAKDNLDFVNNYIEFTIIDDNNILAYKDLLLNCKNDIVKLDSFVKRTQSYFETRKHTYPFIMSKETIDLVNKAIKKLITVYGEAYAFAEGVKNNGVTYLVDLL